MRCHGRLSRCLAVLAVLSGGLAGSCRKERAASKIDSSPALGPVSVKPIPAVDFRGQAVRIDEGQVAARVKAVLEASKIFAEPRPQQATTAVVLELQPFTEGSADALVIGLKLRLRMTTRPEGAAPARFTEDVAAMGQAPLETRDAGAARQAFQRLAERTTEDLVQTYVARQKLWSVDAKDVAAALGASDNDLRIEALRIIGARQLHAQVPVVIRLLADEDEEVRDAALGAVVALRERGAVKALAESRQMRDAREMRKVLDAIATLGGREAQDYLAFVAETHDDEEVRGMAKAALERMARRVEHDRPTR